MCRQQVTKTPGPSLFIALLMLQAIGSATAAETVSVSTRPLGELLFHPTYSVPAKVLSLNRSRISVESPGLLQELPVRVGDSVSENEPLAILDCREPRVILKRAEANVQSAQARLTLARRQIKRTRSLLKERNISEEVLNQREADLQTALANLAGNKATLEKALLDVEQCRILAPFPGVVVQRLAGEGEWISPGQPLVELLDSRRLEVSAQIPLDQVPSLSQASDFSFAIGDRRLALSLRRILPVVDALGRNREARLEFSSATILPGSSGRLIWQTRQGHIPADLLVQREGTLGIFLEQEGLARFQSIANGLEGRPAPVMLPLNSRVIVEGRFGLQDGDPVDDSN